ncbi:MAG: aminoglycoside phosphotransferase family protein [Actinomycetota bacterium]
MFTCPTDLSDHAVAEALRDGWGIGVEAIEYAAVGFGSHHWRATATPRRWFVTVDDLDTRLLNRTDSRPAARDRLTAALSTALMLRSSGHAFVVAPTPSSSGQVARSIDDRYTIAVYPHVEGAAGSFGPFDTQAERLAVVDLLARLHRADHEVPARATDHTIPSRDRLEDAMASLTEPWSAGPFAQPAHQLLRRHHHALQRALVAYDELVAAVRTQDQPLVITHGEPHRGNVIVTSSGPLLIDWDTALLAPPERDLWSLVGEDPGVRPYYERTAGRALDDNALRLSSLWWDLCEVGLFTDDLRGPHEDTDDTRTAWQGLQRHLDPTRWADLI